MHLPVFWLFLCMSSKLVISTSSQKSFFYHGFRRHQFAIRVLKFCNSMMFWVSWRYFHCIFTQCCKWSKKEAESLPQWNRAKQAWRSRHLQRVSSLRSSATRPHFKPYIYCTGTYQLLSELWHCQLGSATVFLQYRDILATGECFQPLFFMWPIYRRLNFPIFLSICIFALQRTWGFNVIKRIIIYKNCAILPKIHETQGPRAITLCSCS